MPRIERCPICLSGFSYRNPRIYVVHADNISSRMQHVFHLKCLELWRANHPDCPQCRRSIGYIGTREETKAFRQPHSSSIFCAGFIP